MSTVRADYQEILRAVEAILLPGQVTELRAIDATTRNWRQPHTISGYFNDVELLAKAAAGIESAKGIYIIPNQVEPELMARAYNRVKDLGKNDPTTADNKIIRRLWLLIDADPVRPDTYISATDKEHDAALAKAQSIKNWLTSNGWPAPGEGDSGNGGHLMYRVDLPPASGLVQTCLQALSAWLDDELVTIDTSVFNPARIWKLYGTVACKGDNIPSRPHRLSRLLASPSILETVTIEQLEWLARQAPALEPAPGNGNRQPFDVRTWLSEHSIMVRSEKPWQGTGTRWVLDECPFDANHTDNSPFVVQNSEGRIGAGCHHNSCKSVGWGWKELRARFDRDYVERQQAWEESQAKRQQEKQRSVSDPVSPPPVAPVVSAKPAPSRQLPCNIDAERAVIGCLLLDVGAIERVSFLKKEDFYRKDHQAIYQACLALNARNVPPDIITLANELGRGDKEQAIEWADKLEYFQMGTPTTVHAEYYARIVEQNALLRRLAEAGERISALAYDTKDATIPAIQEQAERMLSQALHHTKSDIRHLGEASTRHTVALKRLHDGEVQSHLPIFLPTLERVMGGWRRGEQTVLAATTNIGKSTFARNAVLSLAHLGYSCLYISVEMHVEGFVPMFKAAIMGIDATQFLNGFHKRDATKMPGTDEYRFPSRCRSADELEEVSAAADAIYSGLNIRYLAPELDRTTGRVNKPDFTPGGIRAAIRRFAEEYPLDMVAVDSLGILDYPETRDSAGRSLMIGETSFMFRDLAIETNSHCLLLHQLRPEAMGQRFPTHHYFEESKKIAMNADNCAVLIRPEGDGESGYRAMEINLSKARASATAIITGVIMHGATGRFTDVELQRLEEQERSRQHRAQEW